MLELDTDKLTNHGQGLNLNQLLQVRSNFDQLFAGNYEKTLDPKVKEHVESRADELYLQETEQKQVDRASQLWKSLRNVEVLKYDRGLWNTVQQSPTQQQGVMQTVVEQPRDARDNVLTSPGTAPKLPSHTGHGVPEKVETGTRAIGEGVRPKVPTSTAHENNEEVAVTNVFDIKRRNLNDHENSGGHSIDRHVGKSPNWLKRRLENNLGMETASTFNSDVAANRTQGRLVKRHKATIEEWLNNSEDRQLEIDIDMEQPIGTTLNREDSTPMSTSKARFVIRRDSTSEQGWYIHTSYPIPMK
jgi:hypothetical protein